MITIRTNHHPRDILRWWDLTEAERKDFDYLDTEDRQAEAEFVRYRAVTYDLHDMERKCCCNGDLPPEFKGWDDYQSDSFYSGVLIKWVDSFERVVCATYF